MTTYTFPQQPNMATPRSIPTGPRALRMPSRAFILTLPPELFARVAEFCPPEALLKLRMVSREVSTKTYNTFLEAQFTERAFLLCYKDSLHRAVKLARHEKFGKHLKKLTFYADEPNGDLEEVGNFVTRRVSSMGNGQTGPFAPWQLRTMVDMTQKAVGRAERDRDDMIDSEADLMLLTALFCHLRQYDSQIAVEILVMQGELTTKRTPMGLKTLSMQFMDCWAKPVPGSLDPALTVFQAIALSGVKLMALKVGSHQWCPLMRLLSSTDRHNEVVTQLFSNVLHKLELHLGIQYTEHEEYNVPEWHPRALSLALVDKIQRAPNLFCLTIRIEHEPSHMPMDTMGINDDILFRTLADSSCAPELRYLKLWSHSLDFCDLAKFVRDRPRLIKIGLIGCKCTVRYKERVGEDGVVATMASATGFTGTLTDKYTQQNWEDINRTSIGRSAIRYESEEGTQ